MTSTHQRIVRTAATAEDAQEAPVAASVDLRPAQEALLAIAGLGRSFTEAMEQRVGPKVTGNAEVIVITYLDLKSQLRPADIVSLTGMTSGGVTNLLDRLEKDGFIRREYGTVTSDRRVSVLSLTPSGRRLAREYARALLDQMDEVRVVGARLRDVADPPEDGSEEMVVRDRGPEAGYGHKAEDGDDGSPSATAGPRRRGS